MLALGAGSTAVFRRWRRPGGLRLVGFDPLLDHKVDKCEHFVMVDCLKCSVYSSGNFGIMFDFYAKTSEGLGHERKFRVIELGA